MAGEADLEKLLGSMAPVLHAEEYVFLVPAERAEEALRVLEALARR